MTGTRLLLVNGSLGGSRGNTAAALRPLIEALARGGASVDELHLADSPSADPAAQAAERVARAQGFIFATGTYWDSWGSPLQRFFEQSTAWEAGDLWMGKPAAAVVTMHSVGGKEVLSRLQGVLSSLGLLLPPMSAMVYSLAGHLALGRGDPHALSFRDDLWQLQDLEVVGHNLLEAIRGGRAFRPWPVDSGDPYRLWLR